MPASVLFALFAALLALVVLCRGAAPGVARSHASGRRAGRFAPLACVGLYRLVGTPAALDAAHLAASDDG